MSPATETADALAGFVAAEGCVTGSGQRFVFRVSLGALDQTSLVAMHDFLGVGQVSGRSRRKTHDDDEASYTVSALRDLVTVLVPFMDEHLDACPKRTKYLAWRDALLTDWATQARRVRSCTIEGCELPRRARGLCRQHLYQLHGC